MASQRKKVTDSVRIVIERTVLEDLVLGKCNITTANTSLAKMFQKRVLNIPNELDELLYQTIELMGYEKHEVKVGYYESTNQIEFEVFPPQQI